MEMQQEKITQLDDKVKEQEKCKQMLVELEELKTTVNEHDSKIRMTEENHGKTCVEESRAYLEGRVVNQESRMPIIQGS